MPSSAPTATISRRGSIDRGPQDVELDVVAGLWQEVPFVRLPPDAPPELHVLVTDIDNPRRVYAVHRASRRHEFQSLVEKFIFQLREGCGSPTCVTSSCLTCRRRIAGRVPVRRYNSTSARTLAVYMASRDDPESALCPNLRLPKDGAHASLNSLMFPPASQRPYNDASSTSTRIKPRPAAKFPSASSPRPQEDGTQSPSRKQRSKSGETPDTTDEPSSSTATGKAPEHTFHIRERPTNKDHRSFAANMFNTVAFRMLEWLTPQGMAAIRERLEDAEGQQHRLDSTEDTPDSCSTSPKTDRLEELGLGPKPSAALNGEASEKLTPIETPIPSSIEPTKSRRSSEATFRTTQSSNPKRRMSIEPPSPAAAIEEPKSPTPSPRPNGLHTDKLGRPLKPSSIPRGLLEFPTKPPLFENVPVPVSTVNTSDILVSTDQRHDQQEARVASRPEPQQAPRDAEEKKDDAATPTSEETPLELDCLLPQSLARLNVDVVDFMCNTFEEDVTSERQVDELLRPGEVRPKPERGLNQLRRVQQPRQCVPRHHWKAFNEQTLFNVLSDPNSLISSFTRDGELFDSHTLWYMMLRLTRTVPSLVFHSLWVAAGSLFIPPQELRRLQPHKPLPSRRARKCLTHAEAGYIMSICMHALVASVPICPDSFSLREMSRIRSKGLPVSTMGDAVPQPAWLREEFDDAFTDDHAVRLARRLCYAITTRRQFCANSSESAAKGCKDILQPLLDQVDVRGSSSIPTLVFTNTDRLLHEGRVESLMLAWARTVLFHDWDGNPEFSTNGPFAGAMSLIHSIYDRKEVLVVTEREFRMDYFSDRLDSMDVPRSWLSFNATDKRHHLLDFPYLFSPDALVSYFRTINFLRMSRQYEESSSLKARMKAILDPGSLITIPHHKTVLQEMLRTAASSYLVIEVSRRRVLRDAFDQLWRRQEREFLRPLKVHLGEDSGEEGFDSGGVQQEFLRLAIAECLDPIRGAFTVDERTRMAWFAPGSVVELWKYELIGMLVSLAIFNGLTLPITFPRALYSKLLGWPVTDLEHIEDGWPELASGLTKLQEWDENDGMVEDVFALTYEFSVFTYGNHVTREMAPDQLWPQATTEETPVTRNPDDAPPVTGDNRDEYINDYISYLTDVSVKPQFDAFEKGFLACLAPKSLKLLNPQNLQSLVEGVQDIDITELRRYTRYVGWDASHRSIKDFWSVVKRFDDRMKRKLLEFVTASDRVPVGGMRNLQFALQKNGEEDGEGGHLPTAYTCYGILLLPEYRDKEVLSQRLTMAVENAQGFGFA